MSALDLKHFTDEAAAYRFVEARVWPEGPICPHCGCTKEHVGKLKGKSTRLGVYKCYGCRKPFTVKIGTIFESSHVKLHLWLQAMFLICSSKKGISSNQLHRVLGVTLKTAWFMSHRIREAMKPESFTKLGGEGQTVEVDETYIGVRKGATISASGAHKMKVLSLVERGGRARSVHVEVQFNRATVVDVLEKLASRKSALMTDESPLYTSVGKTFASHDTVNHAKEEYVRGATHTNTIEGFFSIFKRGMRGVYQHCSEQHLQRYLTEFDFRYSNRKALGVDDQQRTDVLLRGIVGRRLTYRTTH